MSVFEHFWPQVADSSTTWTTQRRQRQRLLAHCGGDVEKAWPIWLRYARELFARWLVTTGRLGRG